MWYLAIPASSWALNSTISLGLSPNNRFRALSAHFSTIDFFSTPPGFEPRPHLPCCFGDGPPDHWSLSGKNVPPVLAVTFLPFPALPSVTLQLILYAPSGLPVPPQVWCDEFLVIARSTPCLTCGTLPFRRLHGLSIRPFP